MQRKTSRRDFVVAASVGVLTHILLPRRSSGQATGPSDHPTPRAGITADNVLTKAQLSEKPATIPVFDMVRDIPQVVDGIRCNCGCAEENGYYSLLSCFEAPGMAKECAICQGQARLAHRLHKSGKTLDEIRKGIDARFG
jgi:hypothetical protein